MRKVIVGLPLAIAASTASLFAVLSPTPDCPLCGTVSVTVTAPGGARVDDGAYIAVVREGASFRQPAAEAFRDGPIPSAKWKLEPGTYRVVCVARGFGVASPPTASVRAGKTTDFACAMEPALTVSGRVLSEETGRPIEGAAVTPVTMVLPDFSSKWSDLGQSHQRQWFSGTTNRQGLYFLFVPRRSEPTFLIEADGTAPKLLNKVAVGDTSLSLPDAILAPGGALQLVGSFPPSVDPEQYVAVVFSFSQQGFDKAEEPELWQRRLRPDGSAGWRALPPGYWTVRLDTPEGDRLTLGSVKITPGGLAALQFPVAACRLLGTIKGLPLEVATSAKLVLSPGSGLMTPKLTVSAEKDRENQASFEAMLLVPGVYGVALDLGANSRSSVFLGTVATKANAATIEQTFKLPSRDLGGIVVDSAGMPVEGAQVDVCTDDRGPYFEGEACSASSDGTGRWHCSWLPSGKLLVLARKEGSGVSRVESVDSGTEGGTVTLRLAAGGRVSGRFVVPDDRDPSGAHVGFACEAFPALVVQGRTAREGQFELTDLPRCDGQLIVRPTERALAFVWRQVPQSPGADLGELIAERGGGVFAVGSDLALPTPEGMLCIRVLFRGTAICSKLFGFIGGVGTGLPNAPGTAGYFYKLPSGSYRIEWTNIDQKVVARSREFEVRTGELVEVSFTAQ